MNVQPPPPKIVVTLPLHAGRLETVRRSASGAVLCHCPDPAGALREVPDAVAVVGPVTEALLAAAPRLQWLQVDNAGVDDLPLAELRRRGITVTNAGGVLAEPMAEHALGMMFAFTRAIGRCIRAQDRRCWPPKGSLPQRVLMESRLCIVGLGHAGRALAARARALGMHIAGVKLHLSRSDNVDELFGPDRLRDALGAADHVVVCLPLTAQTRGIIGGRELQSMQPTAVLYNIGRGAVIDTEALVAVLRAGRLAGAGLDVAAREPLPADSPLWTMENVLLTFHSAGGHERFEERLVGHLAANVRRFLRGEPLDGVVDLTLGY